MTQQIDRLNTALAGHYAVERELGQGGMATVYLARDIKHNRKVALKVLREDLSASLGKERFIREVKVAAALQHPHVLPLYDSGEADGLLFYVMPYVDGLSLRDKLVKEGELPVSDAVRILRDVADALSEAHRFGVVHRDLKPENVMLRGRHALVTDFGVAKALSEATGRVSLTTVGVALGTPTYMAPEQATADPHVDHRADIYAFGVMAYELLTGRPPFTGTSPQQILAAHVTATAEPVSTHRTLSPALASLVMRCLEKKPADRWQTADELIPQLEALLTPSGGMTPTDTRPLPAVAVTPHSAPRSWRPIAIGAAAVAFVAVGVVFVSRRNAKPLDLNRVLVVPFAVEGASPITASLPQRLESSIVQGLQRTGLGSVTDSRTAVGEVSFHDTATAVLATTTVARRLAQAIGAGLVVTGRVLLVGDSVQVESKLLSSAAGTEVVPIPTASGSASTASALIDEVAQRLMGALVMHRDPAWGSSLPGARASTYAAYRAFQEGNDRWNRGAFAEAGERYRQAFALDTSFVVAAVRYGYALYNNGQFAAVDSLGTALAPKRAMLSPYETQYLNRLLAWIKGDNQAFYAAAQEMARIAPLSNVARYTSARSAIFVNRMSDAMAGLLTLDIESPDLPGIDGIYSDLCEVAHRLSDFDAELRWSRAWRAHPRTQQPLRAVACEARALIGVERLADLDGLFPQFLASRRAGTTAPVTYALAVIAELQWHGHDSTARRLSRVALDRASADLSALERLTFLAYGSELERAGALADSLYRADTTNAVALSWVGVLAAARQDRLRASSVMRQLELRVRPYDRGLTTRSRADILALLGEKDKAVQLLQQAFAEGATFQGPSFHARFGLAPLRGFPPFEAFVKPK